MQQSIIENLSGVALPLCAACALWYGAHFAVISPRIVMADIKTQFAEFDKGMPLPKETRRCFIDNLPHQILKTGRIEAALHTATFQHYSKPYNDVVLSAARALDKHCGVSQARQKIQDEEARKRELARLAEEQRLKNLAAQHAKNLAVETERKALQAKELAERKRQEKINEWLIKLQENPEQALLEGLFMLSNK